MIENETTENRTAETAADENLVTNGGATAVQVDPAAEVKDSAAGVEDAEGVAHVDAPSAETVEPVAGQTKNAAEASGPDLQTVENPAEELAPGAAEEPASQVDADVGAEHALDQEPPLSAEEDAARDEADRIRARDRIIEGHKELGLVPPAIAETKPESTTDLETGIVADGCVVTTEDGTFHTGEEVTVSPAEIARLRKIGKLEPASTTH